MTKCPTTKTDLHNLLVTIDSPIVLNVVREGSRVGKPWDDSFLGEFCDGKKKEKVGRGTHEKG